MPSATTRLPASEPERAPGRSPKRAPQRECNRFPLGVNAMSLPVSRRLDFTEIPVIDLSNLVAGNDDPATIDALGAA